MKTYTLTIIYNELTGELESLEERVTEKETPLAIDASPDTMEKIFSIGSLNFTPHAGNHGTGWSGSMLRDAV